MRLIKILLYLYFGLQLSILYLYGITSKFKSNPLTGFHQVYFSKIRMKDFLGIAY